MKIKNTSSFLIPLCIYAITTISCSKEDASKENTNISSTENTKSTNNIEKAIKKESFLQLYLEVKGMHCQGCADWIARSLTEIDGVKEAKVTHELNLAEIRALPSAKEKIINTIKSMRYSVKETNDPLKIN